MLRNDAADGVRVCRNGRAQNARRLLEGLTSEQREMVVQRGTGPT